MIKEWLLNLYLMPFHRNERLGMSARNRIFDGQQHLRGLTFTLKNYIDKPQFGKTIIDIGCFQGTTSLFFHKELKGVNIIGFEANPSVCETAVQSTSAHSTIKIENYALSDFCGVTEFYITDNQVSSSLNAVADGDQRFNTVRVEKVKTITLDNYLKDQSKSDEKILAIKLDVQGHELKVLEGAKNTLKNTLFVLTEMSNHDSYKGGANYYQVDELLRQKGFKLHNIFAPFSYDPYLYEFDALYINTA